MNPFVVYAGTLSAVVALAALIYTFVRNRVVLIISQSGSNFTNRVFFGDDGSVEYTMEVKIINDSLRPATLRGFELQLLWNDPDFHWLHDPLEVCGRPLAYKIPGTYIEFPRDAVINHRIFANGVMQPGEVIEGMLLGRGLTPIPDCFPHGSEIEMTLSAYDQRGKPHKAKFTLFV
jgi:hypothetical protein